MKGTVCESGHRAKSGECCDAKVTRCMLASQQRLRRAEAPAPRADTPAQRHENAHREGDEQDDRDREAGHPRDREGQRQEQEGGHFGRYHEVCRTASVTGRDDLKLRDGVHEGAERVPP
ncbi:hypothetical protein Skr01_22930 [Sphaerisporangium krabiense]|uniref:Uncharacterized protein n=1 Tax=Sphaerisporangium krabiense TaxID=763782 RepID=A0A7W9DR37_9ACTN|nr:hypothetical protein [Sphaerisporangium krabiense]MBB5628043.1 hypothetical protein [Sphaerisporangium krabiense]GII62208.1 hypothetical protein Skr01_22930 [Sphaerisporangium krabiense]